VQVCFEQISSPRWLRGGEGTCARHAEQVISQRDQGRVEHEPVGLKGIRGAWYRRTLPGRAWRGRVSGARSDWMKEGDKSVRAMAGAVCQIVVVVVVVVSRGITSSVMGRLESTEWTREAKEDGETAQRTRSRAREGRASVCIRKTMV